jgi:hypothetical protein
MNEPIEDVYFNWLYSKVGFVEVPTPSSSHWKLLRELHSIEFVWLISGDDNRAEDGLDIRREFLIQSFANPDPSWSNLGCSVLEMLIAFSRRAEFETDLSARYWFWVFIANLDLDDLNDAKPGIIRKTQEAIDRFVWRTYNPDGSGGMFPLEHTDNDQTKVEIWYQFCEWLAYQEQL